MGGTILSHNADGSDPSFVVPPSLHVPRPDETTPTGEAEMLRGWLAHLRGSAIYKVDGLDDDQLRWRPTATANSLGGLVMHLGYSERLWFRVIVDDEPMDLGWTNDRYAPTFAVPDGWTVTDVVDFYRQESAAADAVLDRAASLDQPSRAANRPTTLRWVLNHMVEETARHVGHMDLTRELLDGSTGR